MHRLDRPSVGEPLDVGPLHCKPESSSMSELLRPAIEGFLLGASLIVAIGAQNAFVLRQGLARRLVFPIATFCFFSDAVLIAAGVGGLGSLVQAMPRLLFVVTLAGAAFLAIYGAMAIRRAFQNIGLSSVGAAEMKLGPALATVAALTFLNPHVYLDTVVLSARSRPAMPAARGWRLALARWRRPGSGFMRWATARACSRRFSPGRLPGRRWISSLVW